MEIEIAMVEQGRKIGVFAVEKPKRQGRVLPWRESQSQAMGLWAPRWTRREVGR